MGSLVEQYGRHGSAASAHGPVSVTGAGGRPPGMVSPVAPGAWLATRHPAFVRQPTLLVCAVFTEVCAVFAERAGLTVIG